MTYTKFETLCILGVHFNWDVDEIHDWLLSKWIKPMPTYDELEYDIELVKGTIGI